MWDRHTLITGAGLSLVLALPAAAQTPAAPTSSPVADGRSAEQAETAAANPASQSEQNDDIIVTATRRETSLQKTPIAISVFNQTQLDRQQVTNPVDLQRFVPSLQFSQQSTSGAVLLTLRGIGNDSAFTEIGDPEVAVYVDGIYSARAQGAATLVYDLERIEVLRGPQGTLFGRNATVGAVSLITAKPKLDSFSGNVELIGGDYDRFGARGAINVPVTDNLAVRFAFASEKRDGFVDYQTPPVLPGVDPGAFTTSGERYYAQDQQSARFSVRWEPGRFSWNINAEALLDKSSAAIPLMQIPRPGQDMWSALIDSPPNNDRYGVSVRSTMNYDISDYLQTTYIAGFNQLGGSSQTDFDVGVLPILTSIGTLNPYASEVNRTIKRRSRFFSHELQLKSKGENAINWILGGFFSYERNSIRNDIDDRDGYRGGPSSFSVTFIQPGRRVNSYAGFGQATWSASDRLNLTGGLRYTSDEKRNRGGGSVTFEGCPAVLPPNEPPCRGIEGQFPEASGSATDLAALLGPRFVAQPNGSERTFDKLTYLARADYQTTDDVLAYGSVSTGFKSGIIDDVGRVTGPETLTNYEIGLKSRLFDRKLTLNVAGYYGDFNGFQIGQIEVVRDDAGNILSSSLRTLNAEGATIYGLEVEANATLSPLDRVQFAGSLQKTRLKSLLTIDQRLDGNPRNVAAQRQLEGNELPHAPRFSATLTYEHDFELSNGGRITPRATVHYETASFQSIFNGDRTNRVVNGQPGGFGTAFDKQKAYSSSDLAIRYTDPADRFVLEGFVRNIEDREIRVSSEAYGLATNEAEFLSILAAPRTFGARLKASF